MARKTYEGTRTLPFDHQDPAPRPRIRGVSPPVEPISRVKIASRVAIAAVVLLVMLYGLHRWEKFLIRDQRFAMNGPDDAGANSTLEIQGVSHASRRALESVFSEDLGRSVYLLPMADRRATLRTVDWVKDASVARLWPNRVLVRVSERQPVAFVPLAASRFGLIDEDGVVLPSAAGRFHLPVLKGVALDGAIADRRERVHRMLRLMTDLGSAADKISEVDVTDRDNLAITQPYEGRALTLLLGDQNFGARYKNFVNHYAEIQQKLPGATTLDLRLEDRITVVDQ